MNIELLRTFFMWCTVLNGGLLLLSSLICTFAGNWVYRLHNRWYPMPRETFNVAIYAFLGGYKILFWIFCAMPYVALVIMT